MEERRYLEGRLRVSVGDITRARTQGIVNAANSSLLGGGGVDGAIHRAGGPEILRECRHIRETRYPHGLPPGSAVATTGGRLAARHVIHTVGPVWRGGTQGEADTLRSAYTESLRCAAELRIQSLAIPAISTGVYAYPEDQAASVAYAAIADFLARQPIPREVELVFFSPSDAEIFIRSMEGT